MRPTEALHSASEAWRNPFRHGWTPWETALCALAVLSVVLAIVAFAAARGNDDEVATVGGEQVHDGATTTERSAPSTVVTPTTAPVGTRDNPWPFGEVAVLRDGGVPSWEVKVATVNADAFQILAENPLNGPPPVGRRLVLVTVEVKYVGDGDARPPALTASDSAGTVYDHGQGCGVIPVPLRMFGDAYVSDASAGGVANGNLCWSVDESKADSLVLRVTPTSTEDSPISYLALG